MALEAGDTSEADKFSSAIKSQKIEEISAHKAVDPIQGHADINMVESSVHLAERREAALKVAEGLEADSPYSAITTNSAYLAEQRHTELETCVIQEESVLETEGNDVRLDCIYDDAPISFEEDSARKGPKMEAQDPLEEVNLGDEKEPRLTFISKLVEEEVKDQLIKLLREFKDCFAWDYDQMPGLSRELIEHRLPIRPEKRPVKQPPRRFALEILPKIKEEIERLLRAKFIRTARFISNLSGKVKIFSPLLKLKKEEEFRWEVEHQAVFEEIKQYLTKPPVMVLPKKGFPLKLYISTSEHTIGSMLAQEDENGVERAVYYLSRMLIGAESRYSPIEKLCLCLYFSCEKLKYYIRPFDVHVYSHHDIIKYFLSKLILHGRVGKWALALTEYSLIYKPLKSVKGQVVADFVVDHSIPIKEIDFLSLKSWKLYFDGSSHRNGIRIGILIISPDEIPTKLLFEIKTACSNNEAEYEALLAGLEILLNFEARNVIIRGDSELVIKQLTKEYKYLSRNLVEYWVKVNKLLQKFDEVILEHIPRDKNQEANELAQIASKYRISSENLAKLTEIREKLGSTNLEILNINDLTDQDWRKSLVNYLKDPNIPTDRKTKFRAVNYIIVVDELYKRGVDGTLLRCLSEHEAYIALAEIHEGICGAHQARERMKWMLLREGLYWPSMIKDCFEYAKSCEECQKHGNIQHVPASELHSIIKPWPFRGWALDLVAQIHPPSTKGHKYIIVAVDYFSKWAEAVPLKEVTQSDVVNFIDEYIIHRFGIPETLTTDQGTVFVGRKVTQYAESLNIKMITSTLYYAQANGQVEAVNKILIKLIKKHIGSKPRNWHETLNQVLWAYRNSPKEATGTTPFRLVYGHKVVLPVEVNLQSVRLQRQFELPSEDYWALMFDELNALDEIRLSALEKMIRQKERISRSYNKKVRNKHFNSGELVWKVILPFDKKSRKLGKWSPNWEGPFEIENVFSNNAYSI
ncbi:uncharacterized protein LOC113855699 [Abrus precatorius]|uniref:Uncharacterized protein LOC113855699 n=1 Tax=Abrus precatorius TaxID=3816 RepID=A0A8B8KH85_ABRPR|nr:uncharacterized protein LOC113855699 [Abrus precatorius]